MGDRVRDEVYNTLSDATYSKNGLKEYIVMESHF